MSPEMDALVVGRFAVTRHEAWRAAQRRRRWRMHLRRVLRFMWRPVALAAVCVILARLGFF